MGWTIAIGVGLALLVFLAARMVARGSGEAADSERRRWEVFSEATGLELREAGDVLSLHGEVDSIPFVIDRRLRLTKGYDALLSLSATAPIRSNATVVVWPAADEAFAREHWPELEETPIELENHRLLFKAYASDAEHAAKVASPDVLEELSAVRGGALIAERGKLRILMQDLDSLALDCAKRAVSLACRG